MSILIDESTGVLIQGITGRIGATQAGHMKRAGTRVVAGVTPGRGGATVEDVPVYESVKEAVARHAVDASVLFVPVAAAEDSCAEAVDAGVRLLVLITENIPVHDVMRIRSYSRKRGVTVVGPTTPGIITPGKAKAGIMPANMFSPGPVGVVSRSGTLAYEIAGELTGKCVGQSTVVGMGADPVVCTDLVELLGLFEEDAGTRAVVVVGEVGGTQEERAADFISQSMSKPVVAYVAGRTVPTGVRMGHAGAIVARGTGRAEGKIRRLEEAGVVVAETPCEVAGLVVGLLGKQIAQNSLSGR